MRKLFAIALLSIHVFTMGGYRLVLNYFEQKADKSLVQKLDNNQYSESELITLKIPLNMPYACDRSGFKRCDGTIKINGVFYNYVNRKLANDTLILQCIANHEKNKLHKVNNEYAKYAGDAQPSSSSDKVMNSLLKLFFSEYNYKAGYDLSLSFFKAPCIYMAADNNIICPSFIMLPSKPPEIV
ncbi:hypothetical protein [Parafilimonas sp.]|uniref:hypothetical protein n=1 Tax=Parafilimonas sp. TaxID=1969739 RepID=UPI0039E5E0AD